MSCVRASEVNVVGASKLHLIDMENLVQGYVRSDRCAAVWTEYKSAVGVGDFDQITVAVAWPHAAATFFSMPPAARRIGVPPTPDAADVALLESVDVGKVARQHGVVVIASGDHVFAPLAHDLRRVGVRVIQVVASGVGVSASLYRNCDDLVRLRSVEPRPLCTGVAATPRLQPRRSDSSSGVAVLADRVARIPHGRSSRWSH